MGVLRYFPEQNFCAIQHFKANTLRTLCSSENKPSAELTHRRKPRLHSTRLFLNKLAQHSTRKKKKSPQRWAALLPATQNATFGDKQPQVTGIHPARGCGKASSNKAGGASRLTLFASVYSNRNQAASTSQRHPAPPSF